MITIKCIYSRTLLVLLGLVPLLIGCSHIAKKTPVAIPVNMNAEQRAEFLKRQQYWSLQGRIGIITKDSSDSASFHWEKSHQQSKLRIYGMLGNTYATVTQSSDHAKIELSADEIYYGDNAQQLLYQKTGWYIPVSELEQWMMGLASNSAVLTLNDNQLIQQLTYAPWQVHYRKYADFNGLIMPQKLKVTHPQITLKFSIHQWQFTDS